MKTKQPKEIVVSEAAYEALQQAVEILNTLSQPERERVLRTLCVFYEVSVVYSNGR